MFLNHGTMRLPGNIVNMRTAGIPQKKDNAARASARRVMMQERDEKLLLTIASNQTEGCQRTAKQHRRRAAIWHRHALEEIDPGDASEPIRSTAVLRESV
jgi:hypothetical protein